ncbi:MAG: lipase maturation factor family protein, partial [Proteobacteria bacterium]|nr:lipase maturation factor family protein [Pseudomonadota bacterium]
MSGRPDRFFAAFSIISLEVLILLTGNYNFFNFLTIFLCTFLLDDTLLRRFVPQGLSKRVLTQWGARVVSTSARTALVVVASVVV